MNKIKISLMVIFACLTLLSCKKESTAVCPEDWCFIAGIDGNDRITERHLYSLMKVHGIKCATEGSVGYGVSVPKAKRSEAIEIIKEDLKKRKYYINLDNHSYTVPESEWRETELNVKFDKCLQMYPKSTDLGAALRVPEFVNEKGIFLYVLKVRSMEREYMGLDKKFHTGHEFEIETALNIDEKLMIKTYRCQVFEWDSKKEFNCSGTRGLIYSSEELKKFLSSIAAGTRSFIQPAPSLKTDEQAQPAPKEMKKTDLLANTPYDVNKLTDKEVYAKLEMYGSIGFKDAGNELLKRYIEKTDQNLPTKPISTTFSASIDVPLDRNGKPDDIKKAIKQSEKQAEARMAEVSNKMENQIEGQEQKYNKEAAEVHVKQSRAEAPFRSASQRFKGTVSENYSTVSMVLKDDVALNKLKEGKNIYNTAPESNELNKGKIVIAFGVSDNNQKRIRIIAAMITLKTAFEDEIYIYESTDIKNNTCKIMRNSKEIIYCFDDDKSDTTAITKEQQEEETIQTMINSICVKISSILRDEKASLTPDIKK